MGEGTVLIVGVVLAVAAVTGLAVWGAFALAARARRRQRGAAAPESAPIVGAAAFGRAPVFTGIPNAEVPARIPFGGSAAPQPGLHTATQDPTHAPGAPAEIALADVPLAPATLSYTPAMLVTGEPAGAPLPPAPIEMPAELSVRVGSAATGQRPARPLIDSVPDFNAPPVTAAAPQPAVLSVRELQPTGTSDAASGVAPDADLMDVDDMDATIIAGRRNRAWVFESESGQRVPLSSHVVLLGRNPSPVADFEGAQLVTVRDLGRTVSKTHARLERHESGWHIADLGSTNGVYLIGPDGTETELEPGSPMPATERFMLGDMSARIFQEE